MRRDLLIAAGPGEWRAALVEDGTAAELHVERGDRRPAGSIVLGRVVRAAAGLGSAFVDIGEARPGLAPLREALAAGIALDEGARAVVQIRRELLPDKGARLTTRLSGADRAAIDASAAALDPPAQLDPAPGFAAALALTLPGPPDEVLADDPAIVAELRAAFPTVEIGHRPAVDFPLDLDAAFAAALAPRLDLAGGGCIRIVETPAAVLIDVDTGAPEAGPAARAALASNLDAARLIARQARLRNLGGAIVVDFVGLDGPGPRERVRQEIAGALAADPAGARVLGWTRLGHLEIVRPYRARSLAGAMLEAEAPASSAATVAFAALRALWRQTRAEPGAAWRIAAGPAVAAALHTEAAAGLAALEARLGRRVAVAPGGEARSFAIVPG